MSEECLSLIAQDTEFRTRLLIQQAQKYAWHERRAKLTVEDLNMALRDQSQEVHTHTHTKLSFNEQT